MLGCSQAISQRKQMDSKDNWTHSLAVQPWRWKILVFLHRLYSDYYPLLYLLTATTTVPYTDLCYSWYLLLDAKKKLVDTGRSRVSFTCLGCTTNSCVQLYKTNNNIRHTYTSRVTLQFIPQALTQLLLVKDARFLGNKVL